MMRTVWAVVHDGRIELLEPFPLSEGAKVLVTVLPEEDEEQFWMHTSQRALADVWNNTEDDIYAELLEASGRVS